MFYIIKLNYILDTIFRTQQSSEFFHECSSTYQCTAISNSTTSVSVVFKHNEFIYYSYNVTTSRPISCGNELHPKIFQSSTISSPTQLSLYAKTEHDVSSTSRCSLSSAYQLPSQPVQIDSVIISSSIQFVHAIFHPSVLHSNCVCFFYDSQYYQPSNYQCTASS